MFNEEDIRMALKPFSKDLKYVERIKQAVFCAVFKPLVDEEKVEEVLKKELNPEFIEVNRRAVEVIIKIIDWD